MLMATGSDATLSRQSRQRPPDFEIVFIEHGRLECEAWYQARRTTVTRWLVESGKKQLLKRRADFVRHQRQVRKGKVKAGPHGILKDRRKIDPDLLAMAIRHLQSRANGGWAIVPCQCGNFIVGTVRRPPGDVLDMAIRKGFDRRRALQQIKAFAEPI